MNYRINEVFASFQGEGYYSGRSCVFVRFAGCNLKCEFCDTDHGVTRVVDVDDLTDEITSLAKSTGSELIVFTGGEPLLNNLIPLAKRLSGQFIMSVETNATIDPDQEIYDWCFITASPKTEEVIMSRATELKLINHNLTVEKALGYAKAIRARHHFVNPVDVDGKMNMTETAELVRQLNIVNPHRHWRVGIQLHKIYGVQ
jgi:7-carboxy-7-deazaguanine synthase